MNYDVEDPEYGLQPDLERKQYDVQPLNRQRSDNLLSRLRSFNISSIGSFFSGPLSAMSSYVTQETALIDNAYGTWDYTYDLEAGRTCNYSGCHQGFDNNMQSYIAEPSAPNQTRFDLPLQARSGPLSELKRLFRALTRVRHADLDPTSPSGSFGNDFNASHAGQNPAPLYAPSLYDWGFENGSPLTTESDISTIPSPVVPGEYENIKLNCDDEENVLEWDHYRLYSSEIKEGKRADRSYGSQDESPTDRDSKIGPLSSKALGVYNDQDEWYGLEYTMALSCRERHPSDSAKSAGEHSKSRESWAAIHQGTVHPYFEDEDYCQWKNWHRYLDRQDERKKHKRGLEFKARSKDLAWLYVEEMHARDLLYWQKEVYGVVERDLKEYLSRSRPDPYFPPKKHNLGWYLKRSLSVACLHELRPLSGPTAPIRSKEYNDFLALAEEFPIDDYGILAAQ